MLGDLPSTVLLLISGFVSGLFLGMGSGTTGAVLITTLTVFLGYSVHSAIGTSLLIDCLIGIIAGVLYFWRGQTNLRPAVLIAGVGAIGAFLGSQLTSAAPEAGLLVLLSVLLILIGISFLRRGLRANIDGVGSLLKAQRFKGYLVPVFIAFGFLAGFVSGFSGLGVGGVIGLALILLLDYDLTAAIGTALLLLVVISGSGALGHALHGEVLYSVALLTGAAAAGGAVVGSLYATRVKEQTLGRLIGAIVLIMGLLILVRAF